MMTTIRRYAKTPLRLCFACFTQTHKIKTSTALLKKMPEFGQELRHFLVL